MIISVKLNYKFINIAVLFVIIYLLYQTKNFWLLIISKILSVLIPLVIAFAVAYMLYPIYINLRKRGVSKTLSIIFIYLVFFIIFSLVIVFVLPILVKQIVVFFDIFRRLSLKYNFNLDKIFSILKEYNVLYKVINFIECGSKYITNIFVIIILSIYLLYDMDNIKEFIRKSRYIDYIKCLDDALRSYMDGFTRIMVISFFEYTLAFILVGHPNALLLGFLSSIGNLIPYFGGILTNIISLIMAYFISPYLFVRALILSLVLSIIDGYIINPYIYGKTNKIPSIITILAVFIGSNLFGFVGVMLCLPFSIIILTTIKYYKDNFIF